MLSIKIIFSLSLSVISSLSFAVIGNSGGVEYNTAAPIGASLEPSCKSNATAFGIVLRPTCNGTNLRGFAEGNTVNPNGGKISMSIALPGNIAAPLLVLDFPVEGMFPKNYGTKCMIKRQDGNSTLCNMKQGYGMVCSNNPKTIPLVNSMICPSKNLINCKNGPKSGVFESFNCEDGKEAVGCLALYGWNGANLAASSSYYPNGYASCHLRNEIKAKSNQIELKMRDSANGALSSITSSKILDTNYVEVTTTQSDFSAIKNADGQPKSLIISFTQDGNNLKQVSTTTYNYSTDAPKCLDVTFALVGGNQFCGSFYSPIMLFFDDQRPNFSGMSGFKLYNHQEGSLIYWPERKAPGYFLAIDKNGDGKINDYVELFGKEDSFSNGFEKLRSFDDNRDSKIDHQDKIFKKLLLWNDKNSDGVADKGELSKLKSRVKTIGLRYHSPRDSKNTFFGNRAEILQESSFVYETKDGEAKTGAALDIWFYEVR